MNIMQALERMIVYVSEGAARIFSPSQDTYPTIGVHPFEGMPNKGGEWED